MKQKPNNCMERIAISATPFRPHFKWETQGNGQALGKVSKEFLLIAVCGNRLRILQTASSNWKTYKRIISRCQVLSPAL
jgi:hypothetical protein